MRTHLLSFRFALALALGAALVPVLPTGAGSAPAPLTVSGLPPEFDALVDWALGLFGEADLALPPLHVVHHGDDDRPCRGRAGLHRRVEDVSEIHLCDPEASFSMQVVVLHELAHAWAEHSLSPERETAFRELRGYEHWRDYEAAPWHEDGTEQAAEIMVWGLSDTPLAMVRITNNSCAELEAGYRALTGTAPLHGFTDHC